MTFEATLEKKSGFVNHNKIVIYVLHSAKGNLSTQKIISFIAEEIFSKGIISIVVLLFPESFRGWIPINAL